MRLVIHREDDEIYEQMDVELVKKRDRGLGLSIVGKKSGPGVFISEVVKGGAADLDGRLVQVPRHVVWLSLFHLKHCRGIRSSL